MSGTEKRQVAEMVEFCDIAGVWVLIMKNHKIQPEELELWGERDDEQYFSHMNLQDGYKVYLFIF